MIFDQAVDLVERENDMKLLVGRGWRLSPVAWTDAPGQRAYRALRTQPTPQPRNPLKNLSRIDCLKPAITWLETESFRKVFGSFEPFLMSFSSALHGAGVSVRITSPDQ
jgi:hypothetical protein